MYLYAFYHLQQKKKAVLLGVYEHGENKDAFVLSSNATKVNAATNGLIEKNINM